MCFCCLKVSSRKSACGNQLLARPNLQVATVLRPSRRERQAFGNGRSQASADDANEWPCTAAYICWPHALRCNTELAGASSRTSMQAAMSSTSFVYTAWACITDRVALQSHVAWACMSPLGWRTSHTVPESAAFVAHAHPPCNRHVHDKLTGHQ